MAQGTHHTSRWSRGAVTLLIVVWLAVAIGNWLAHHEKVEETLGRGESENTVQEVNIPEAKPHPWRADVSELQAEVDAENAGALSDEGAGNSLVVATPVAESSASAKASADAAAMGMSLAASEGTGNWGLVFASYHRSEQALAMMTRLSVKSITSHIERVQDSAGETIYRVQGDQVYSSEEKAHEARQNMVKLGFDAMVIPM